MSGAKIEKVVTNGDLRKGVAPPAVKVTQNVPLREGARAPQIATPANVPTTSGPISVTKPKG